MSAILQPNPGTLDLAYVDECIARIGRTPDAIIPILHSLQDYYGYLPETALRKIAENTDITPAAIAGVSSFYDLFRRKPVGKHIVRVCRGTACHVTGADRVEDALRRHLGIPSGDDTDPQGDFTIEQVACLGCCTLAPVVRIGDSTFGYVNAEKAPGITAEYLARQADQTDPDSTEHPLRLSNGRAQIRIGLGSCCMAKGSDEMFHQLQRTVARTGAPVDIKRVGCVGMCHRTPLIEVVEPGKNGAFYAGLAPAQASEVVLRHFEPRGWLRRFTRWWEGTVDSLLTDSAPETVSTHSMTPQEPSVSAFLDRQVHIATEDFGKIDPLDLDEYVAQGGFKALKRCLDLPDSCSAASPRQPGEGSRPDATNGPLGGLGEAALPGMGNREGVGDATPLQTAISPARLIDMLERSGLRGRGGAGFPTASKWRLARQQPGEVKYVICNGDEGDPGAFMDRMLLESFPYRIIEGLAIAAFTIGAHEGIFYIRHEYPLAVKRVRAAIKLCQQRGWLGDRLMGSDYPFRLSIKEGAGAFVCGEETALIASIEGKRGMPQLRPPFPAQEGLWGAPTIINNVETLAMVPWIVRHGAEKFAAFGTKSSKGTKVFALAGNVQRGGLIEVPMGTTIREIVEDIGGGVAPGRKFKAVQIGGPSGGCIPARLADTPVDFEHLRELGAIMGSGGLVVLDDTACMVDIARYFLQFTQNQSCGKCTFCRIGTRRMLDILDRLCAGRGQRHDLTELERLGQQVGAGSLCGLGKTAPNPVLTTLRYFHSEYEAHLHGRCPAGKCTALIQYHVRDNCTGCTLCAQACPVDAIPITPYSRHVINPDKCTRCDSCRQVCPANAIEIV